MGEMAKREGRGASPRGAVHVIRSLGLLGLYTGAGACLARDIPFVCFKSGANSVPGVDADSSRPVSTVCNLLPSVSANTHSCFFNRLLTLLSVLEYLRYAHLKVCRP
jgi:hypothetical protein